jgi:PBP4 family serine-type D-alanyl-D-alanine carboxypeptidase
MRALVLFMLLPALVFAADPARPSPELQSYVDSLLALHSLEGSSWSIMVRDPESETAIVEHTPVRLLSPASVTKMITAAAAIDRLGPDYRFHTRFYTTKHLDEHGVLNGDLLVFAGGDPSMETKPVDSLRAPWMTVVVDSLYAHGLRTINGDIRLSPRGYRLEYASSYWELGDLREGFAPSVDGFGFNNNVCRLAIMPGAESGTAATLSLDPPWAPVNLISSVKTGDPGDDNWADYQITPGGEDLRISGNIASDDDGEYVWLPVQDPSQYWGEALKAELERSGITVSGDVYVERPGYQEKLYGAPFYVHESAPLIATLALMCKESDNYSAEYVLRALGMDRIGSGSSEAGLRAITVFLKSNGVDSRQIRLVDGCGLARRNLVSAQALTDLLSVMQHHKDSDAYKFALSHSGIDGTLDYRMNGKLAGRVRAKTGTMTYISTLAGYLTLASGKELVFAILCNNFHASRHYVREIQDKIVERVFDEFSN